MRKLNIDPDFKDLIQPLTADEFTQLEQNIIAEGKCRETIKIWRGYIIDGHHRYTICGKHNIPFAIEKISLRSKADVKIWIANNQLGRRNLTPAMKIEIAAKKAELQKTPYARKQISADAGVSESTVQKYIKIAGSGNADFVEQVRKGKIKIGTAFRNLRQETKTVEKLCSAETIQDVNIHVYTQQLKSLFAFVCERAVMLLKPDEIQRVDARLDVQLCAVEGIVDLVAFST